LARVNFLREEPGGRRFFVNDLNGPLYILDKKTKQFTIYLDFNGLAGRPGLFQKFTFERNFATGLINFIFDPDYARNGVFYTIHMEDPTVEAAAEPRLDSEPIVYEQPLNERMRAFMRLEFLWQQLSYHAGQPNAWSSRSAVAGLLEILAITSRGDARGDVLKELERQMSALRDFQNRPGVDGARLRAVLTALMRRREELNAAGANFMQKLRESEFLNAIKHRSAIPGGTCEFDLPDFYQWLSL
jgi:hypothetical protein